VENRVNELMVGMIDPDVHCNPRHAGKKNLEPLEAARKAEDAQIKAVVLKWDTFPSGGLPGWFQDLSTK
jgi:hypothetical protein